jgi:ATP-binding cassette subfamily F protein 3
MLAINNLTYRIGGRVLLDGASAQIPASSRVGLVGRNGIGKSTLFKLIVGELAPESGGIEMPRRTRMGLLAQEAPSGPESLIEVVLAADAERSTLLAEAARADDPHRIAEIQTRLADIGAHSAPARAAAILAGLGFSADDQTRACNEFSGGWRMRVALAAALFSEPDLLLLDEPTNYLDLEGTLWLEAHLARYPHSLIVISHDRDLLDSSVNHILHLDRGKLTLYRGGYTSFARQRAEQQMLDAKVSKKQEVRRKHLQAFVDRFRAKATKARQAQSRLKLLAKMEPLAASIAEEVRPIVLADPARRASPPIIALDDVSVGYEAARPVLKRVTLRIDDDDRIALLGANGNGKSTLAKLLAGRLAPSAGSVVRGERLSVGYFAQHQLDELNPDASTYDHLRKLMPDSAEAAVRTRAGTLGFSGDMADTPTAQLSGGEKARLLLGLATMHGPHMIILDEPTNHLDVDARGALVEAINNYTGAVILISHDRYLLDACADRLWLVHDGAVAPFAGDLEDYRKVVLGGTATSAPSNSTTSAPAGASSRSEQRRAAAEKRSELAPLRKRVGAAEKEIATLNTEIAAIDRELAGGLYGRDPARATALAKSRAAAQGALARAEAEWLEASEAYEAENV